MPTDPSDDDVGDAGDDPADGPNDDAGDAAGDGPNDDAGEHPGDGPNDDTGDDPGDGPRDGAGDGLDGDDGDAIVVVDRLDRGYVVVDKPSGPTSYDVAGWVGDLLGVERTAHVGTLDPNVHGVLPVLLGRGVKLSGLLARSDKSYVGVLDCHGDVAGVQDVIAAFEGEIYQRPPKRSGVNRELRTRAIHRFDALEVDADADRVLFRVDCEAGTYVRKLCHDVGLVHGTGAHMQELRRVASGPFSVEDAHYLQDVADAVAWHQEAGAPEGSGDGAGVEGAASDAPPIGLDDVVRPLRDAVAHLPSVTAAPSAAGGVAEGQPLFAPGVLDHRPGVGTDEDDDWAAGAALEADATATVVTPDGALVAVGTVVGDPDADDGAVVEPDQVVVAPTDVEGPGSRDDR